VNIKDFILQHTSTFQQKHASAFFRKYELEENFVIFV